MKTCTTCNKERPLSEYTKLAKTKDGLGYTCRECRKAYRAKYRASHLEEERERDRRYRAAHYEKLMAKSRLRYKRDYADPEKRKKMKKAVLACGRKKAAAMQKEKDELLDELCQDQEFRDLLILLGK